MENPRPEKVAVVTEVRERLSGASAALLTEYRGLNVADMQALRRSLREAGGEYSIYKNTLVRFAANELGLAIDELLTGPTAIAFVPADGEGDPVNVAKALKEFAKGNPNLVVKGGVLGDKVLSADEAKALAEVAPRGAAGPAGRCHGRTDAAVRRTAPGPARNLAYGLQALIDQGGAPGAPAAPADTPADADEAPAEAEASDAPQNDTPVATAADETPAAEAADTPEES